MRYSSLSAAKRWVFRADLKLSEKKMEWKRVPFHRTRNGKSPTTKRAATVSWNHQLATVGRSKALTAWDVGCTRAAVHQVLRSLVLQTPVNCDSEFIYWTRCGMSSQCNSEWSSWDKPWSNFRFPLTTRWAPVESCQWWSGPRVCVSRYSAFALVTVERQTRLSFQIMLDKAEEI